MMGCPRHNASFDESRSMHFMTLMVHKNPFHVLDMFDWAPLPGVEYSCTIGAAMSGQSWTGVFF